MVEKTKDEMKLSNSCLGCGIVDGPSEWPSERWSNNLARCGACTSMKLFIAVIAKANQLHIFLVIGLVTCILRVKGGVNLEGKSSRVGLEG